MNKKHKYNYMSLAREISLSSYCSKKKVGSILVKDNNIISTGYNGTVAGLDNTCEIGENTKESVLHSEANAILSCAKLGISTKNAILFITLSPCVGCAKLIIQSGIKKVYFAEKYKNTEGLKLLKEAKVKIKMLSYYIG